MLLLVSAITFLLVNLAPGGPSALMRMDVTPEQRAALSTRLGLDDPVPLRYALWLGGALHGDLGTSLGSSEPVAARIAQRLPNTLLLAGTALAVSILVGIPLGVVAALRRNSVPDFIVALVSVVGVSVPAFWLGIMLILLLSVQLNWLPSSGLASTGNEGDLRDRFVHLLMPAIVLSTTVLPYVVRFTRSALLDVLGQEYVRTATAKGLSRVRVIYGHALRNALVPVKHYRHPRAAPGGRLGGDGGGVRLARYGSTGGRGGQWTGLSVDCRDHRHHLGGGRREQSHCRHGLHLARPADSPGMSTAAGALSSARPDATTADAQLAASRTVRGGHSVWARMARNPLTLVSFAFLVAIHLLVFIGPLAWTIAPQQTSALDALLPPGPGHPLGTDDLGRDELSRLLHGGQVTLLVGFAAMLTATLLGLLVGATAGFYGGWPTRC